MLRRQLPSSGRPSADRVQAQVRSCVPLSPGRDAMPSLADPVVTPCESAFYRRADCRFTRAASVDLVELGQAPSMVHMAQHVSTREMEKYERTRSYLLLERVEEALAAPSSIIPEQLPGLLRELGTAFIVHVRESVSPCDISDINGLPSPLAIMIALVEILDRVLPVEQGTVSSQSQSQDCSFEPAKPEAIAEVLREVCGSHAFVRECVECLTGHLQKRLRAAGAVICAAEFEIHALIALRFVFSWSPATGCPKPRDRSTLQSVQDAVVEVLEGGAIRGGAALALDVLRLSMQQAEDAGKARKSGFRPGRSLLTPRRSTQDVSGADGAKQSAAHMRLALQSLEWVPKIGGAAPVAPAVRLLAALADRLRSPSAGETAQSIATAVSRAVVDQPFTPQLAAAIRELACQSKPRSSGFFVPSRSPELRSELGRALAREDLSRKVAQAASQYMREGHAARERGAEVGEDSLADQALLDDVEAIFGALHGQDYDCLAELRFLCAADQGETGSQKSGSGHSLSRAVSNFRQSARKLVCK